MLKEEQKKQFLPDFAIPQNNLKIIGIGVLVLIVGFLLMTGGGSDDPNVFSEAMFDARRLIISPLVIIAGFCLVGWGIMHKPAK